MFEPFNPHNERDYHKGSEPPIDTQRVATIESGNAKIIVEILLWNTNTPRMVDIRRWLFGKGEKDAGRTFPSKSGLFIKANQLDELIEALQKAKTLIEKEASVKVVECGNVSYATSNLVSPGKAITPSPLPACSGNGKKEQDPFSEDQATRIKESSSNLISVRGCLIVPP